MATLPPDDRPTPAPAVKTLLDALRSRIRQYIWLEGCAAAVACLGLAFWATLAIDWFFEPSPAVRVVMLAAVAAVLMAVLFRLILRRVFVPITDSNAATVLERRFPQLNDSLLTAVVLGSRSVEEEDIDPQMLARTCREAADRIAKVDLKKVFNPRPLWLNGSAAVLLFVSVALFAILFMDAFGVWASRTLAMSSELWPRNTRLEVDGFPKGVQKIARGSDLEVMVRADTRMPQVPETVEVRYRVEGGGRNRATMDRRGAGRTANDHFQEYAYTFRSVLADVHFDVAGGDDRVRDLWIQTVDSPTISQIVLDCELPSYIRRKQPPLTVSGVMQVPLGSRVIVRASEANKDLVRVQINTIVGDQPSPVTVLEQDQLTEDRRGFSHSLAPLANDATLLFTLTDADGIKSREPVRLTLVATPDEPPQMTVQLDGIGTAITPRARVPVAGQVTDDYGLAKIWIDYAVDQQKPGSRVVADLSREAPVAFHLNEDSALEVKDLGLKPGQKLLVGVKAADLCDLGRGPNEAGSERWQLEVVAPEQLRAMLEARELMLRQRFEQILQEVTETRDLLARLELGSKNPPPKKESPSPNPLKKGEESKKTNIEPGDEEPADSPARQQTLRFLRVQGALSNCRKNVPEIEGVAEAFDDIRKQLINNRIDTEELKNRLQAGIAEPLRGIAQNMFPELEHRLDELQSTLDDAKKSPAFRDRAQQQAQDILLAMQKVLDRMIELEDFNEAVELLRNIVKMQENLDEQTQKRHKQKIRDLLKE